MTTTVQPATLDISGSTPISLATLVQVEIRKMADTRAGKWLLIAIAAITALVIVLMFLANNADDRTFIQFMGATGTPQGFLLPVMGILLVTSEWSQRTALITFTITPERGRVMLAKVLAALAIGAVAIVIAMAIAALAASTGGAADPWEDAGWDMVGKYAILQATGLLQGLAFGALFLNSAAAIVFYFVGPTIVSIIVDIWGKLHTIQPWIDLNTSQTPLFDGSHMSGKDWVQLLVGVLLWVVLPGLVGIWRVLRTEVK